MPNRIIRDGILTSEKVASLDWAQEVFYRRLHSIVDDYGRHEAGHQLLRSKCYPLQTDTVRVADISRWITACETAGLILVYAVSGKQYLEVVNFGQQRRSASKCPEPQSVDEHLKSFDSKCSQPIANAHLGGGGGGDVFEDGDGDEPTPRAREISKSGKFAINPDWKPSEHFSTLAHQAGLPMPQSDEFNASMSEFIAYWISKGQERTQHEWDHALLKSLKADRMRGQGKPARKGGGNAPSTLSFAERDRIAGMQRWEEMCGRKHPDLPDEFSKFPQSAAAIEVEAETIRRIK